MNPRYIQYCRAHGRTPEEMLAHDTERFPGGKMCGFILWNTDKVRAFSSQWGCQTLADTSLALLGDGTKPRPNVHRLYDEWLEAEVTRELAQ